MTNIYDFTQYVPSVTYPTTEGLLNPDLFDDWLLMLDPTDDDWLPL